MGEEYLAREKEIDETFMDENEKLKRKEREVKFSMGRHGMPIRPASQAAQPSVIGPASQAGAALMRSPRRVQPSASSPNRPVALVPSSPDLNYRLKNVNSSSTTSLASGTLQAL